MRTSDAEGRLAGARRAFATDYTAFLEFGSGKRNRELILDQFSTWLREKGIDADLEQNTVASFGDNEFSLVHHRVPHGHNVSGHLIEPTDQGVWKTEVLLHVQDRDPGWLRIKVTNDQGRFVAVPRLANYIMDAVETFDGPALFTSVPEVFGGGRAEEFLELVCDPARAALILAAGSDASLPFDPWRKFVAKRTKQVRGLAHVIVLDPLATEAFAEMVGDSHAVRPGTIRTFLPEVDPAVEADGRRHRVLGARRLGEQSDQATSQMFGRIAREAAAARVLPTSVAKVERALRRVADDYLLEQLQITAVPPATDVPTGPDHATSTSATGVVAPESDDLGSGGTATDVIGDEQGPEAPILLGIAATSPRPEQTQVIATPAEIDELQRQVDEYLGMVRMVQDVLGLDRLDADQLRRVAAMVEQARSRADALDQLRRSMQEKEAKVEALEDLSRDLDGRVKEAELDLAISDDEKSKVADENRWLRRRLRELEDYEGATAVVPDEAMTKYPESFDELLEWAGEADFVARGVIFCGDPDKARDLDDVDDWKRCVKTAWDALLLLQDYLRARKAGDCNNGIDHYLEHTPSGYLTMAPGKFASTETGQTMKGHREERKLPVPTRVKKSGFAVMKAHFKLAKIGMVSPRMYILDQYSIDGSVYVGYIGPHLTNTQTN